MSKRKLIIILLIGLFVVIVGLLIQPKRKNPKVINLEIPQQVIIPTRKPDKYETATGAVYMSPTTAEYIEIQLISDLRKKCPISNDVFEMKYDYRLNKFIVTLKANNDDFKNLFRSWMNGSGYDRISEKYFLIKQ